MPRSERPVAQPVITGLGPISALGIGLDPTWAALGEGRSGLDEITGFDATGFPSSAGGELSGFRPTDHVPKSYRKATKVMARDSALAVAAARAAVEHAGLRTRASEPQPSTYPDDRLGCLIGAGLISADTAELGAALASSIRAGSDGGADVDLEHWGREGIANLTPLWMLKYLPNMLACHVTIIHGTRGPSNTLVCGEASGLLSLGEASRILERGAADAVLTGGVESKLNPLGLARMYAWDRLRRGPASDEAWRDVRPYDPDAGGSVLGEGGAIFVLESADAAAARGARAIGVLSGHGSSHAMLGGDGPESLETDSPETDSSKPDSPNLGIVDACERALEDAGVTPGEIDLIVPQGTGVRSMDRSEAAALGEVFGDALSETPIAAVTPYVGDLVAGAGAFQAAVALAAIAEQRFPARLHGGTPAAGLLAGSAESAAGQIRHALVCCGSLTGQCAAVVLSAPGVA
ncbi:MAG: beta-ketoacyl synthase N-terminal-like domain-containing protein [Planctomycetota bacterium]